MDIAKGLNLSRDIDLSGKLVIVDAGHGGEDPGAVGQNGLKESEVALKVAYLVGYKLKKMGARVVLTRPTNEFITLKERVEIAKEGENREADCFVSIHCNAVANRDVSGIETYHYRNSSTGPELADSIQTSIMALFDENKDRGVKGAGLYVTKYTPMPAVLTELEFISNPEMEKKFKNPNIIYKYTEAISEGIIDYIK